MSLDKIWGPQMRRALLIYFKDYGVTNPDAGDLACLGVIGIREIDRRNFGFKSSSFLGMASLLVPALLDSNHVRHREIAAAVKFCKNQLAAPAAALAPRVARSGKPRLSLVQAVKLGTAAPKLPMLAKSLNVYGKMASARAAAKKGVRVSRAKRPVARRAKGRTRV